MIILHGFPCDRLLKPCRRLVHARNLSCANALSRLIDRHISPAGIERLCSGVTKGYLLASAMPITVRASYRSKFAFHHELDELVQPEQLPCRCKVWPLLPTHSRRPGAIR